MNTPKLTDNEISALGRIVTYVSRIAPSSSILEDAHRAIVKLVTMRRAEVRRAEVAAESRAAQIRKDSRAAQTQWHVSNSVEGTPLTLKQGHEEAQVAVPALFGKPGRYL